LVAALACKISARNATRIGPALARRQDSLAVHSYPRRSGVLRRYLLRRRICEAIWINASPHTDGLAE